MFSQTFWRPTLDRAVKSSAQAVLGLWAIADGVYDIFQMDAPRAFGIAAGAFLISLLTSIGSAPIGPTNSPSTV